MPLFILGAQLTSRKGQGRQLVRSWTHMSLDTLDCPPRQYASKIAFGSNILMRWVLLTRCMNALVTRNHSQMCWGTSLGNVCLQNDDHGIGGQSTKLGSIRVKFLLCTSSRRSAISATAAAHFPSKHDKLRRLLQANCWKTKLKVDPLYGRYCQDQLPSNKRPHIFSLPQLDISNDSCFPCTLARERIPSVTETSTNASSINDLPSFSAPHMQYIPTHVPCLLLP
jgi:hypothetical protein